jgi:hypothetical protein
MQKLLHHKSENPRVAQKRNRRDGIVRMGKTLGLKAGRKVVGKMTAENKLNSAKRFQREHQMLSVASKSR